MNKDKESMEQETELCEADLEQVTGGGVIRPPKPDAPGGQ